MKKQLYSTIYIFSLMTAGLTIRQAFAQRSPAVEAMMEVSVEENASAKIVAKPEAGYNFTNETKRIPANIATKRTDSSTPYSYIGPIIFLLALPMALWIVVSKKIKIADKDKKPGHYPKTHQFKPYKTDYQEQDFDDEENEHPKAS